MPFSGGIWTPPSLPGSWSPAISGQAATPTDWNTLLTAIAAGLSTMICKDGQSTVAADIPFAGFRLKGVGSGILVSDAANVGQLQDGSGIYAADTGTADVYAIAPDPAISAYAVGQLFRWKVLHTNVTTTPDLAVSGLTAGTIVWPDGTALIASALPAGAEVQTVVSAVSVGTPTHQLVTVATPYLTALKNGTTATTQAQASNDTKVATDAYVDRVGVQQVIVTQTGAVATGSTVMPLDDTTPQIGEGDEYMTATITPKSATSKLLIQIVASLDHNLGSANNITMALFQDSTNNALAAVYSASSAQFEGMTLVLNHEMVSGTTSATTFRMRAGPSSASVVTFNGANGGRLLGGVMGSSIIITEIGI